MTPTDSAHNYVVVGALRSPGRAAITGLRISYNWDIQEAYGFAAAFMTYRGRKLVRFNLTLTLTTAADFLEWEAWKKLIEPPATKLKPFVVEMEHPVLAAAGVRAVTILDRGEPERSPGSGWMVQMSCIEWRPPFKVLNKPRGAIPAAESTKVVPQTAADLALAKATARNDAAKAAADAAGVKR